MSPLCLGFLSSAPCPLSCGLATPVLLRTLVLASLDRPQLSWEGLPGVPCPCSQVLGPSKWRLSGALGWRASPISSGHHQRGREGAGCPGLVGLWPSQLCFRDSTLGQGRGLQRVLVWCLVIPPSLLNISRYRAQESAILVGSPGDLMHTRETYPSRHCFSQSTEAVQAVSVSFIPSPQHLVFVHGGHAVNTHGL